MVEENKSENELPGPGPEIEPVPTSAVAPVEATPEAVAPETPPEESAPAEAAREEVTSEVETAPEPVVKVLVPVTQLSPGSIFEYGGSRYELVAFGILVKNLDTGAVGNIDAGMCVEIKT